MAVSVEIPRSSAEDRGVAHLALRSDLGVDSTRPLMVASAAEARVSDSAFAFTGFPPFLLNT